MKEQLKRKAKEKVKEKATTAVKNKVTGGSGGGGSAGKGGKGSGGGKNSGGKSGKVGSKTISCIIGIILVFAVGYAAYWFMGESDEAVPVAAPGQALGEEIFVHFIDVGQADAILIQSNNHAVLIDAATTSAVPAIQAHLERHNISTIDVVVATHPHADHIGGMAQIIDLFDVHAIWMPDVTHNTRTFERMMDAVENNGLEINLTSAGDVLELGPIHMTAVSPNGSGYNSLNDYSIVLRLEYGETSFLFTGDVEVRGESEIVDAGWNIRSDVLQAPHHGSRTSSSENFIDAVQPQIAVISVGATNRYGHPHDVVLERYADRDVQVKRTDELGTIIFVTDGTGISLVDM